MTLEQGDLLYNRYRVLDILGRGGMGSVYHAIDESLGVEVAVKENMFVTEEYEQQFQLEAVILASLRHPNLPRVTDHFTIEGQGQYLVMDYIEGRDLRHLMENGPLPEAQAVQIGVAVCDALTYLHTHKRPVLHRDIKPGNVRIAPDDQVYLVDFGLAKMSNVDENTLSGARAMTPGYSPPEQYGTSRTDARTDVYFLGATLYAALTGFIPEDGLARVIDEAQLTPLRKRNPKVSEQLAAVIEKAMEPQAANRYQSAEDFKRALLGTEATPFATQSEPEASNVRMDAQAEDQPSDAPVPAADPPSPSKRRKSSSFFTWIIFFAVLAAFAVGANWIINDPGSARASLRGAKFPCRVWYLLYEQPTSPLPTSTTALPIHTLTSTPTPDPERTGTSEPEQAVTRTRMPTMLAVTATATDLIVSPTPSQVPTETMTPTSAPTMIGGGIGEIAFASSQSGIPQIYTINIDGSNIQPLTNELNGACQPAWAPNGKKLVYVSPCPNKNDQYPKSSLFILDLDSNQTTSLPTMPGGDFEPAWSPDGTQIAFSSLRGGYLGIYALNLADQAVIPLTALSSTIQSRQPSWSPDGKQIVYTVRRFNILQIWSMSPDGTNQIQLFRNGGSFSDYLPVWSPDGSFILFSEANAQVTSPSSLMRFTLGSDKAELIPIPIPVVHAQFSPNGQWIAYETSDTKNQDIFIYNLLTGNRQRLTSDPAIDFDPAWRP